MEREKARRRAKVRRFIAKRREEFLEVLRRTGNVSAAAKAVGIDPSAAERRRARDAAFAIAWDAALVEADRRLAGATDCFEGVADAEFETIRRGRRGRLMIVATRTGKWCKSAEETFLSALRGCGNVAAAARAAGFSESLIWQRRRKWPGFERRMEEALEEAEVALEFRLAAIGNNLVPDATGTVASDRPPCPPMPFDPELALRFLKWREEKRRGRGRRGRGGCGRREATIEEVRDEILRRISAIRRHREKFGGPEAAEE